MKTKILSLLLVLAICVLPTLQAVEKGEKEPDWRKSPTLKEFMKTEVDFGKDAKYEGPIHTALSGKPAVKIIVTDMYKFPPHDRNLRTFMPDQYESLHLNESFTGFMTGIKYIQLYAKKEGRIYDLSFEVNSDVPWGVPEEEAFWGWEECLPIFEEVIKSFRIL
jgi:hypothetical protein